jgi:hypothetical protein
MSLRIVQVSLWSKIGDLQVWRQHVLSLEMFGMRCDEVVDSLGFIIQEYSFVGDDCL